MGLKNKEEETTDPYLSNLSLSGQFGSIPYLLLPVLLLSLWVLFLLSVSSHPFQPFFPSLNNCSTFTQDLNSLFLSHVSKRYSLLVLVQVFVGKKEEKRSIQLDMQLLLVDFGKRKGHLLSLLTFILHIKWGGVFGVGLYVFLTLFWSA